MGFIPKISAFALGISLAYGSMPAHAADELVLGYTMAKTGPYVSLAIGNEIAADIAVEEVNSKGGINGKKLVLAKFDSGGDPKAAVTAVRRFAQDQNALAVIGPFSSSECTVAFPAGESEGIVQTSMSSSAPNLTKGFSYAFRNTVDEGKVIAAVMKTMETKNLPATNVAIAYAVDDAVSKSIGTKVLPVVFANRDVKETVDFKVKAFDLSSQVSQLVRSKPDVIGMGANPEAGVKLAIELHRQGYEGRLIGGTTVADPDLPKRMAPAGEGMMIGTTYHPDVSERAAKFAKTYAERAKAAGFERLEPNQMDAATYDIVLMYAEAIQKASVSGDPANLANDRAAIRDYLVSMKAFPGVEGDIRFDQNRDSIKPIYIIEAKAGAWHLVDTHDTK